MNAHRYEMSIATNSVIAHHNRRNKTGQTTKYFCLFSIPISEFGFAL